MKLGGVEDTDAVAAAGVDVAQALTVGTAERDPLRVTDGVIVTDSLLKKTDWLTDEDKDADAETETEMRSVSECCGETVADAVAVFDGPA